ncbi:MAG TPA: transferrin receptor-like dimerization domain-containing protein [Gemmatimonadaceae bacterium]|nr:transferrin receptor-like dimerization domain-containing protein [Gemmatimonadaceae bacterium]
MTTDRLLCSVALAASTLLAAVPLRAQSEPLPGYSRAASEQQKALENRVIARPSADSARTYSRFLSSDVHIAGTPAQARTRDYVIDAMKRWGLETEVRTYDVWMPHTTNVQAWRVAPDTLMLHLAEGPVAEDSTSWTAKEAVIANGYSGTGSVTAPVVYVNYGLIEDYAQLDSMGVSVKGKIAVARYGRSYRGIKAREAEKRGAVGLVIYSDPEDDGFVRGDVYPEGPMRPSQGVQRGSIMNGDGDPSTPGYPSTPGAKRVPTSELEVSHIPVVPMSYGNAAELLRGLRGADVPREWQGGLPFHYHAGPGPVVAHLLVESDTATAAIKQIWDTFGIVRGSEFPDQVVIIGGHRDAWGPGAADNVSGTTSVMEAAHAVADALKAGHRPKRTIIFATWDAEEWGLLGSTEYVEDDSLRLKRGGVAYLNQDVAAQGAFFGGGGSPSLRSTLRDIAKNVKDPSGKGSVYQVWRDRAAIPDSAEPRMGDPGGGSDFAGFYNHLGIPIAEWGFGGAGGVYHSFYDDFNWMTKFGDPDFAYHATAAKIGAAMVLRLANADILPYDYVEYARTMKGYVPRVTKAIGEKGWSTSAAPLATAIDQMEQAASEFGATRDAVLARGTPSRSVRSNTNAALLRVERALTRPEGLRTRPWFRNLIYAADENNGYANMVFPSVNEAIRAGDRALAEREIADLASRFQAATKAIQDATNALGASPAVGGASGSAATTTKGRPPKGAVTDTNYRPPSDSIRARPVRPDTSRTM